MRSGPHARIRPVAVGLFDKRLGLSTRAGDVGRPQLRCLLLKVDLTVAVVCGVVNSYTAMLCTLINPLVGLLCHA